MRNEYDDLLGGNTSYDGLIAEDDRRKQQAVSTNLNTALRYNPDIFSKTKKISQQTGLPSELVERNLPEVENQIKANEYDTLISGTTAVKNRMTDQDFAKLAHDDLESLVTIEELLSRNKKQLPLPDLKQGFAAAARQLREQQDAQIDQRILNHFMRQGADNQTAQNVLTGLKLGRKHLLESGVGQGEADYWFSQQVVTPLGQIKTSPFDFDTKRRFDKSNALVRGIAKGVTLMEKQAGGAVRFGADTLGIYEEGGALDQMNQALEGRMQAIGERSNPFDRNLEGAITSIVSQSPALAASIGTGSAIPALAGMFIQVAGDEYETGRRAGLTYGESTTRAAIFGAAEVIGEKFGLGDLIKGLRGAAAGMPTRDVLTYITKEIAKQIPSEQLTTALQFGTDMLPKIGLNQDATAEQYVQAVMDTLVQTVLQGGIMIGSGVSVNAAARAIGRRYEEAQATDQSAQTLEQVFAAAANSNLRMRDTQSFSELVNEAAELGDGSPAQVYLNAQVLMQTMQDAGVDPRTLPSVADQLPNAVESGADVVVSVGELAAAFSGTNQERTLLDQARFSEDGATVAEQREFLAKAQQAFQAEADKITAAQADQDDYEQKANSVFDKVLADLTTAGRHTNDVNQVLADLVKRFYVVKSAQIGMTPDQLYEAYPLRVQGESTTTGELLDQESPEFQSWFQDSKVVDTNGKPLVVYHGGFSDIKAFRPVAYFGGQQVANQFADPEYRFGDSTLMEGEQPNVMPVYLSLKNPKILTTEQEYEQFVQDTDIDPQMWKDQGFDGLIYAPNGDLQGPDAYYVAFDPTQIKSVNNRGTFDPNDPNVLNQVNGQTLTPEFKAWSNDAPLVTSEEADTYDFNTGEKVVMEAYHGTKRPDRVGSKFKKSRATSGPMSFFTSSPELASNYAQSKRDTSLAYEDGDYSNWFKYKGKGMRSSIDISRSWYFLPSEVKETIAARMGDIRMDDDGNVIYEEGGGDIGAYQWELQQTQRGFDRRGNPLKAAVETWLTSGALFDQEERFMEVLKLAGFPMKEVEYDSPNSEYPFVFKVYIKMMRPLVTNDIPQEVVDALNAAAKRDRSRAQQGGADMWDKNTRTLREWVAAFNETDDNAYVWTSIPDKVTDVFRSLGYDGIIDWSGKSGTAQHPVYIPFNEDQIKSAIGNKGTFSGKAGLLNQDALPIFYSALHQGIAGSKVDNMPAAQWKAWLAGNAGQLGIKKEEIEWTGINDYFDLRGKDKLTKQDVLDYLAQNGVEVEETMLGETNLSALVNDAKEKFAAAGYELIAEVYVRSNGTEYIDESTTGVIDADGEFVEYVDLPKYLTDVLDSLESGDGNQTRYSDWQLDGGRNYRELLLKLPPEETSDITYKVTAPDGRVLNYWSKDIAEESARTVGGTVEEVKQAIVTGFKSKHWSPLNVLAHVRFNDRTDAQGNKVLFIEEIQSDWAQEGRKKGFGDGVEIKQDVNGMYRAYDRNGSTIELRSGGETFVAMSTEQAVRDALKSSYVPKGIPSAPFVGETKAWVALAVKRMMRYAAENGYDKVAFVNGQQSAERYDLSKQIDAVHYTSSGGLYVKKLYESNFDPIAYDVKPENLADYIGKEAAERLLNAEYDDAKGRTLENIDLKVGGEGMITFYDKIVPTVVNEQLKKLGGGKLGTARIGTSTSVPSNIGFTYAVYTDTNAPEDRQYSVVENANLDNVVAGPFASRTEAYNWLYANDPNLQTEQPAFDITPEMRDQILSGLPLFQGENNQAIGTFDPANFVITLKQGANLSTFLHEVGHFFLEVQADLAFQQNAPEQVRKDMDAILQWFGVSDIGQWKRMTLDQQRPYHEKFARGFEAYLFEGNAPSAELQGAFNRFRAWLTNVYQSLQKFLGQFNVELTNEVREVMGRMVATNDEIEKAAERRNLSALFTSAEEAGMTDEEFVAYQSELTDTQVEAVTKMLKRSYADIKWMRRARDKQMREFQKDGAAKRSEARIEARRHILQQPIYKAWQFLSGKEWGKVSAKERASKGLDPRKDSLFVAIAKLGGFNRDQVIAEWGMDIEDIKGVTPVFGKPVFRKEGGMSPDAMGEALSQYGYLTLDENGKFDMTELEEAVMQENMGDPYYSIAYDYEADNPEIQFNKKLSLAEQLPAGRLNRAAVGQLLGGQRFAEVEDKLRNFMSSDGLDPDVVAELFRGADGVEGFTSGRDLIDKLIEAVAPSEAIERLTDQIVLERYGDITSEKAAQEAADMALHNEFMLRAAANEVKTLAKLQGSVTAMARAAKEAAVRAIGKVKIKDLKPSKYAAAAMRFSRAAEDALAKKDMEGALAAKRQQFLNIAMAQYAYEVINQQRRAMQEFAKLRRSDKKLAKTYDINLVETARAVLVSFGVNADNAISSPFAAMEALDKVKAYNPDLYAVLDPIVKAAVGASRDQNGNPVNYVNLTVEEFNGLRDTVRQILHQARAEKQIRVNGRAVELEQVNAELIEQLNKVTEAKPVGQREAVSDKDRRRFTLSGLRAGLRRMEAWVESQDMGSSGAFHSYLFDEVSKAVTKYRTIKNDVLRRYIELLRGKQQEGDFTDSKINAPEIGYAFNGKQELLGAMLHTGNDGNMRKLLLGRGWGQLVEIDGQKVLDSTAWDQMIKRLISEGTLTKSDYDFLQATWDLMDELKADAQQSHNYLYGYYFDEVTAKEIETPFGVYRGGYAPAKADAELVQDAAIRQGVNEIEQDFNYLMPSTGNGFTKGRVEYNRPLVMDLRLVAQHIDQVLRFTYIQPAVSDVLKLVKRGEFSNALYAADQQVTRSLILPWLQRTALQQVTTPFQGEDGKALQRFFTGLRRNTGMMVMTANFVNALQQVTGLSLTAVKVEPRYLKGALARYVGSPIATSDAIAEQSEWMKIRLQDQSFELQSELQRIMEGEGDGAKAKGWIQRHAYFMQRAMQNMVDVISWSAAYDKALAENKTEDEAVRFADSIVRTTQGSLLPEDVSRFESGNAFTQLFTQFASYFNMQANLLGTEFAKIQRSVGMKKGAGRALYVYTMGFMIPALMADAIVRTFGWDWDDDDDDGYLDEFSAWFFGGQLRTALAMFPIVGQAGTLFLNRFNSNFYDDRLSTSPAIGAIESATGAPVSAYKAIFDDGSIKKAIKDTLGLLSLITGIPFSALGRPFGYLADYSEGKVDPVNEIDFARGVMSGKGREEERQ